MDSPLVQLAAPVLGEEEIAAAVAVLRGGRLVQGPEVAAFEEEFAAVVDGRQCVAVNSGTSALLVALLAHGIGPGDEVVVPSFSFAATANAVRLVGAVPVFADIDPGTFCLDPAAAAAAVTPRTAALLPVHLYGHPAAAHRLAELAGRHGLALVEDACQAHAAALNGKPVGSFGTGCFSFYATKNMHTLEGGMVVTGDPALARAMRLLRNQGMEQPYSHEAVGANWRMTDLSAAIGRVQLRRLPVCTERRRSHAAALSIALAGSGLITPSVAPGAGHVWHQYTVRVAAGLAARDSARQAFADRGIRTGVYYPTPIHRLPPYAAVAPRGGWDLAHTDRASDQVLSLPVHPSLTSADVRRIAEAAHSLVPAPR